MTSGCTSCGIARLFTTCCYLWVASTRTASGSRISKGAISASCGAFTRCDSPSCCGWSLVLHAPRRQRMKLDQEKRQFNDVLGYLHREIFTCEVHLKQVEKDLIGASKVMQVRDSCVSEK